MTTDRDVEKQYSLPEFIAKLRRLADSLENGEAFAIQVDGEKIKVPMNAVASVEHEREDGREELEFQLSWDIEAADEASDDEDDDAEGDDDADAEDADAEDADAGDDAEKDAPKAA